MRFFKVPYVKQLISCKKSDQNMEKNQSYENFCGNINFVKHLYLIN